MSESFEFCPSKEDNRRSAGRYSRVAGLSCCWLEKLVSSSDESARTTTQVPNLPDGNVQPAVHLAYQQRHLCQMSLNKLNRWELVEEFRDNIQSWNEQQPNLKISVEEKVDRTDCWLNHSVGGRTTRKVATVAYHSVEVDHSTTHKYARKAFAQGKSLAEPTKPPKKRRQKRTAAYRRTIWPEYTEEPTVAKEPFVEVTYVITTPTPSPSLYEKFRKTPNKMTRKLRSRWDRAEKLAGWGRDTLEGIEEHLEVEHNFNSDSTAAESLPVDHTISLWPLADFFVFPRQKCCRRQVSKRRSRRLSTRISLAQLDEDELVADWTQVDEEDSDASTSGIESEAESFVSPTPFTLIPTELQLLSDSLDPRRLRSDYGRQYWECQTLPRRFCISIAEAVGNVMRISHGPDSVGSVAIKIVVVVEILGDSDDEDQLESEDGEELSLCRVWLNGLFTDEIQSTSVDSAVDSNLCHSVEDILCRIAQMVGTFPLEYFPQSEVTISQPKSSQSRLGPLTSADCTVESLNESEATDRILFETRQVKMIQRQITAVEKFARRFRRSSINLESCEICLIESADSWCLAGCRHWFCADCWREYLTDRLSAGVIPLCCPAFRCGEVVDMDVLRSTVPLRICEDYSRQLTASFLRRQAHEWSVCPKPICSRRVRFSPGMGLEGIISCGGCGTAWCSACQRTPHWPASCQQSQLYAEVLKLNGDDLPFAEKLEKITQVQVKSCPSCHGLMEKASGCNHMSCGCGQQFCWSCVQPWANSHYNCPLNSSHGYQEFFLVDVKSAGGLMSRVWYQKCSAHHKFFDGAEFRQLSHRLKICADRLTAESFRESSSDQLRLNWATADQIHQNLVVFYKQTHRLLENLYLWLSKTPNRWQLKFLCNLANQVDFVLRQMEEAALNLRHLDVRRQFDRLQSLTSTLVLAVLQAKKAEKSRLQR